jgi:hypothetical protein
MTAIISGAFGVAPLRSSSLLLPTPGFWAGVLSSLLYRRAADVNCRSYESGI